MGEGFKLSILDWDVEDVMSVFDYTISLLVSK